jgi:hypothetical protein
MMPLSAIEDVVERLRASGQTLILCGALPQPAELMRRAELHRMVGAKNICVDIQAALVRAGELKTSPAA